MDKYTFSFSGRHKLVIEKISGNSFSIVVKGKEDTDFRFSKKRVVDLISHLKDTVTFGTMCCFPFNKTANTQEGSLRLEQPDPHKEVFDLTLVCGIKTVFSETHIPKKQVKKMIKVMKEVYRIE